jgi:hypothetical protein
MSSQQLKIGDRLKIKELGNASTASWHYFNLNDIVVITKIENQDTPYYEKGWVVTAKDDRGTLQRLKLRHFEKINE